MKELKYKIGQTVYFIHSKFVQDKTQCSACHGLGQVQLLDGKWYDCPKCNLLEVDYDGFDIRDPEMAGWKELDTGKTIYTIHEATIVATILFKSVRGYVSYTVEVPSHSFEPLLEKEIFSTREDAEKFIEELKEKTNDLL